MNELLQMYNEELQELYGQSTFTDYSLVQKLIYSYFGDEVPIKDIQEFYEGKEDEETRIFINNLGINY